jgi:hypothetical protein
LVWTFGESYFPGDWIFCGEASDPRVIISLFEVLQVRFFVELFVGEEVFVLVSSFLSLYPFGSDFVGIGLTEREIVGGLEEESCTRYIQTTRIQMVRDVVDELVIIWGARSIVCLRLEGGETLVSEGDVGEFNDYIEVQM